MINSLNGFLIEKDSGTFHFCYPMKANLKDCYDAHVEAINKIVEIAKQEEAKAAEEKAKKEVKASEEVTPEVIESK